MMTPEIIVNPEIDMREFEHVGCDGMIASECTYYGTYYLPPEYEFVCHGCGANEAQLFETHSTVTCTGHRCGLCAVIAVDDGVENDAERESLAQREVLVPDNYPLFEGSKQR